MSASPHLSPKQVRAISALLTCRTVKEAAAQAGCGESTLRRWLSKDVDFQAAWREARGALVEEAVAHAMRSATAAALVLHQVMMQSSVDFARIAAARCLLDLSVRTIERDTVLAKMAHIERLLEEAQRESEWRPEAH